MKNKICNLILVFLLLMTCKTSAQNISEIPVDLNNNESCKNYIAAVCEETINLLKQDFLPPAPNYDLLKQAVEKISDGQNTVILDDVGYPSIMFKVEAFDAAKIWQDFKGVHPMFKVNGKIYPCVYISKYENFVIHNRAYSLPNVDPRTNIGIDVARTVCKAKGRGWHLTSNIELAGLAYICRENNFYPHGNTNADIDENFYNGETGRVTLEKRGPNGKIIIRRMATGSGPASWAHNGKESGIYDLNGNVWELVEGIRLVNGEIQILKDNNGVLPECWSDWKAINKGGKLVKPGSKNTWHIDSTKGESEKFFHNIKDATPFLSLELTQSMYPPENTDRNFGFATCKFKDLKAADNLKIPAILQLHSIAPLDSKDFPDDDFWARNYGERRLMRGGMWARSAGVFGSSFAGAWNDSSPGMGFRSSYINLEEN